MYVLFWIAAAWLSTAVLITLAFLGARRSHRLYAWMFGEKPATDARRVIAVHTRPSAEPIARLAA